MVQQRKLPMITRITSLCLLFTMLTSCAQSDLASVENVHLTTHVTDWRDEIIYQVLTDRFANGSPENDFRVDPNSMARYHGGDWQGIIDHLDYIEALGVTALWISPIVRNVDTDAGVDGYHGYWAQDLTLLNPHFGDLATLRDLVNQCHARGIKIIVDIVTNHLGQLFYYDVNLNGQPDELVSGSGSSSMITRVSEYDPDYESAGIQAFTSLGNAGLAPIIFLNQPDIFRVAPMPAVFQRGDAYHRRGRILDYTVRDQVINGDFPGGLKDLNTENMDVVNALIDAYANWALLTDIDGFRIDTIKHVDYPFWQHFLPAVRAKLSAAGKNKFLMFGEAFDGDDTLVGSYTGAGLFDSVFYFPQKFQVFGDIFQNGMATQAIQTLHDQRAQHYGTMPQPGGIGTAPTASLVNFIDNHDLPRFLDGKRDSQGPAALRAALSYLLTEDGMPCIYYGTEQEFSGGNDPSNREDLWPTHYDTSGETFRWTARLTKMRHAYPALRRGDFSIRWVSSRTGTAADAGIVAFERTTPDGDFALVIINAQGAHESETSAAGAGGGAMTTTRATGEVLVDILSGDQFPVASGNALDIRVPAYGTRILVPQSKVVAGL